MLLGAVAGAQRKREVVLVARSLVPRHDVLMDPLIAAHTCNIRVEGAPKVFG